MKTIAIIPAKGQSLRCPDKNIRQFAGRPLFLHSVQYARNEGIEPIVSTDSEAIMALCREHGVHYVRETVDDSTMANCVRQVLKQVPCEYFVILQPTSPLRHPGLLTSMLQECWSGKCESAYTAQPIKPIGHWNGHFLRAYREQDVKQKFMFFDGNILVGKRTFFERSEELFNDDSVPFPHDFPANLQIDTEEEFAALEQLALHGDFSSLLPVRKPRRVCIVSNRPYFTRNYSAFVDSCDVVIRISKMCNIDTGLSGFRTDMAVVACWQGYLAFSRKARHMDALLQVPFLFFDPESMGLTQKFCEDEQISRWSFLPPAVEKKSYHFSTFGKAVVLADWLFPDSELYCLADLDVSQRTGNSPKHTQSQEKPFIDTLLESGRLTNIIEDDKAEADCLYSTQLSPAHREMADKWILCHNPTSMDHRLIRMRHPQWKDDVRLSSNVACRVHRADTASVVHESDTSITMKWDRWGIETFNLNAEGVYDLAPTA